MAKKMKIFLKKIHENTPNNHRVKSGLLENRLAYSRIYFQSRLILTNCIRDIIELANIYTVIKLNNPDYCSMYAQIDRSKVGRRVLPKILTLSIRKNAYCMKKFYARRTTYVF